MNTLNWPSYVNERIAMSIVRVIKEAHETGELPETLLKWVGKTEKELPSIRSCVTAPEGWILLESDFKSAEMWALAKSSGDKDLQRVLEDPDPEWALLQKDNPYGAKVVRVAYAAPADSGIALDAQDPAFIMHAYKDGKLLGQVTDDMLARDKEGNVLHAGYDIHWSVAERIYEVPRETMVEKVSRNAGKVINFSSAYGASPASLERKIESDTGVKPDEGVGQKGLDAIATRQPRATEFLEEMAAVPKTKGYYRAASGRIRHCITHGAGSGVGWRTRNSLESALGRELRNFPMQESVASTSARACKYAMQIYRRLGLKARPMTCLYDSLVTLCPLEERFLVSRLHDVVMSELNTWTYEDQHGKRTLMYGVDNEMNYRWSTRPSKAEQAQLDDPTWHPTPDRLKKFLTFGNWELFVS